MREDARSAGESAYRRIPFSLDWRPRMHKTVLFATTLLFLFGSAAFGNDKNKQKETLTLRALSYRAIPHQKTTYYTTQGYSNTTCYGSGADWGYSTTISMNCQTTTTPPQDI